MMGAVAAGQPALLAAAAAEEDAPPPARIIRFVDAAVRTRPPG
jgi:hypothetical protein